MIKTFMKTFLHVGCDPKRKDQTTYGHRPPMAEAELRQLAAAHFP